MDPVIPAAPAPAPATPASVDIPAVLRILAVQQWATATRWADDAEDELSEGVAEASKRLWTLAIVSAADGHFDGTIRVLEAATTVDRHSNAGDALARAAIEVVLAFRGDR